MTHGCRSYSQAGQDLFVLEMLNGKRGGYFLEIGANSATLNSNTYILEEDFGWQGLMIEYEAKYQREYLENRKNSSHIIADARTVPYRSLLKAKNWPINIDYLQIDLDVDNRSTLDVLEKMDRTVFPEYKFATITFEHDFYRGDFFETRKVSREIFARNGYKLLFPDVFHIGRDFEDWYVCPDLVTYSIPEGTIVPHEYTDVIKFLRQRVDQSQSA
jgi:hypothetical protein